MPYERVSSPSDTGAQEWGARTSWIPWACVLVVGVAAAILRIDERVLPLVGITVVGVVMLLERFLARRRRAREEEAAVRVGPVSRFWWFGAFALGVVAFVVDLALPLLTSLMLLLFAVLLLADAMIGRREAARVRGSGPIAPHLWAVLLVLAAAQWVLRLDWWVAVVAMLAVHLVDAALARRAPRRSRA